MVESIDWNDDPPGPAPETRTTTIYARVPRQIKKAAGAYAAEHGMTLANAIADLLRRGLEAPTPGSPLPLELWCAECLYDLRGRNGQLHQYPTDEAMFAALAAGDPVRSVTGSILTPRAVTSWRGTPVCMDHLRIIWTAH